MQYFTDCFFFLSVPRYAAPEVFSRAQLNSFNNVDFEEETRADVFAFAICLWEILTREIPWENLAAEEIRQKVSQGERPPLPSPTSEREAALVTLATACWSQDLWRRPRFGDICSKLLEVTNDTPQPVSKSRSLPRRPADSLTPLPAAPALPPKQAHNVTVPPPKPIIMAKPLPSPPTQPQVKVCKAIYE